MSWVEPPDLPPDVIARALDGDAAAFRLLHRSYDPTVRWAVGQRVRRWPELVPRFEDILQEVWCELTRRGCKRLRYHDPARGKTFRRFLALISARLSWRIVKRRLGHGEEEMTDLIDEDGACFEERLMDADLAEHLVALARERLNATDWRVLEGYYIHGERLKDIGAVLGMNENAVFQRHGRLLKKLRALVQELLGEAPAGLPPELVAMLLAALLITGEGEPPRSLVPEGSAATPGVEVHHV